MTMEGIREMGKASYPKLFAITLAALACIFIFFFWRYEIEPETFLNSSTIRFMIVFSLLFAVVLSFAQIKWGKGPKLHTLKDYLKLYAGMILVLAMFCYVLLTTLTWLLPGQLSTYSSLYEYSSSGRHSCSGASLYDPDLDTKIKVCHPNGNLFGDKTILITKRTNQLGMVVTHAVTIP